MTGTNDEDIRALEAASLDGLPALLEEPYDGWLVRVSKGCRRRANCVWPLGPSTLPLAEKIGRCEALYAGAGLPCLFKLTQASRPSELDAFLGARGYRAEGETIVQVMDLSSDYAAPPEVECYERPEEAWISTWASLSPEGASAGTFLELLRAVTGPSIYVLIRKDGVAVACARAAIVRGWVGLFDLIVSPGNRGQGIGRCLVDARLAWAYQNGARRAFVLVGVDNNVARTLQRSIGYTEAYRYWYRIGPMPGGSG